MYSDTEQQPSFVQFISFSKAKYDRSINLKSVVGKIK